MLDLSGEFPFNQSDNILKYKYILATLMLLPEKKMKISKLRDYLENPDENLDGNSSDDSINIITNESQCSGYI